MNYPTTSELTIGRRAYDAAMKQAEESSRLADEVMRLRAYRDDIAALLDPYRTPGETDAEVVRNLAQVYIMASALTEPATLPVGVAELERLRDD